MKKVLIIVLLLSTTAICIAQQKNKFYAYCCVTVREDGYISFISSSANRTLANSDNTPIKVNNLIGAMNELAKHGFEYVDYLHSTTMLRDIIAEKRITGKEIDCILMRKLVSAEHELTNGLHFFTVKSSSTPIRQVELPPLK